MMQLSPKLRFKDFRNEWILTPFKNIGEFKRSYSYSRANEGEGTIAHIHYGDIHSKYQGKIFGHQVPTINVEGEHEYVQTGELIFADASEDYNDLGKCIVVADIEGKRLISGLHTHRFSPIPDVIPSFIMFYTQTERYNRHIRHVGTGISVLGLSKSNLEKLQLLIPTKEEQQKISDFFSLLDFRIEKQQEKVEALQKQRKGLLQKIFSQELRFKADDGKEFPEWEYTTLSNKIEIGSCIRVHQKDWKTAGIPFYRARDIVALKNGLTIEPLYISKKDYDMRINKSGKVQQGDVMVTGVGTIGVPYLILDNNDIYFKDGNVIWLKNNNTLVDKYLYYYMLSDNVQNYIKVTSGIGTVGTYTIENARKTPLLVPCSKEQQKISDFLFKVDQKYEKERAKLEALKVQRRGFMSQMFI